MVKKYSQLYLDARKALLATEEPAYASMLARQLVCHVTAKTREEFLRDGELYASEQMCEQLQQLLVRALNGEPLAYILGQWEFYGLQLNVNANVLIPRDDTCAVTDLAIRYGLFLQDSPRILDLCTGSGCIGLAVAGRLPDARVTLADVSREALAVARSNIQKNHMTGKVSCIQADAWKKAPNFLGKYDLIVSNPPYITTQQMLSLDKSVRDFEPHLALHGGQDGLDFYRAIAANYKSALHPGGYLAFEFGEDQGDDVCAILEQNGYTILERSRDYNQTERAVIARLELEDETYGDKENGL